MPRNQFTKVKTAKGRKLSSTLWIQRQLNDPYVQKAKHEGYRSRAAFKLIELCEKFQVSLKDKRVLDLGAAPGSWTQVAILQQAKKIIAVDLLHMESLPDVDFIQNDFTAEETIQAILEFTDNNKVDVVLSDMAPNTTGNSNVNHMRIMSLCEHVFEFCKEILNEDGIMILKIFQGGEEREFTNHIRPFFQKVRYFKPTSSRKGSSEMYIVATGFKNTNAHHDGA